MPLTSYPERRRPRFLELTFEEWTVLVGGTIVLVALMAGAFPSMTLWPGLGVAFTLIVIGHLCMTVNRYVAFPDLIAAAACLQWIVAPWLAESYPPHLSLFRMMLPPSEYLRYALPATVVFWIGLHLPASRRLSRSWTMPAIEPLTPRVRHVLDLLIVIGLIVDWYSDRFPPQLAFLAYLLASFRFMGALGWMVTRTPGWGIRVVGVMLHLTAIQSSGGLFYLVIHWGGYFLLVFAFMRGWRWKMAVALVIGVLGLSLLQSVKPTYRVSLREEQVSNPVEALARLVSMMWDRALTGNVVDRDGDPGDVLVRFNQGWIIARVMTHVPKDQPYARGGTLADAALFSIVPRFLVPSKAEGASRDLFRKYTGVDLADTTRMGLGIIGEMYANFGTSGIIATFIYGLAIGTLFLWFADKAQLNPLWWAAASIVLLPSVEPGFNVEDIANHVVKASIVLIAIWKLVPAMTRLLDTNDRQPTHADVYDPAFDDAVTDH
jgi:hypothetical protein